MPKYTKFLGPLSTYRRKVPAEGPLADKAAGMVFDHTEQMSVVPGRVFQGKSPQSYRTMNRSGSAALGCVGSPATPKDNKLG
jgi:hypothetical protein